MDGHLQMSPLVEGRRVLVTTNSGVVRVFELSATDAKTPFREVAETAIEGGEATNLTRFALMQNGQFWIADNRLTKYDVQAARGRLMPKWIDSADSAYLQPPVAVGQAVVSVRRKLGMPGAIVSAVAMQERRTRSGKRGSPRRWPASRWPWPPTARTTARSSPSPPTAACSEIDSNQNGPAVVNEPIAASDPFRIKQPSTTSSGLPAVCWPSAAARAAIRSASSTRPAPLR